MNSSQRVQQLPCEPTSVTRARHFVRDLLLQWDLAGLVEDAQLATSELVANAVRHARTDLQLTVSRDAVVTVAIRDGDPQLRRPVAGAGDALAESGRGLHIVAAVSSDWGITVADGGKVVWFSLELPDEGRSDADVLSMAGRRPGPVRPVVDRAQLDGVSVNSQVDAAV